MPTLNVPQSKFLAMQAKYRAFVAGFGSGKTWVGCAGLCAHAWEWPRINAGYFAPSFPQIDRNLYERANDCRWWALSPVLRELLTQTQAHGTAEASLCDHATHVLEHINSLYTVYSRLMVYDRSGRILCASHPQLADGTSVLKQHIDSATLQAVLQLSDSQSYHVSPWTAQHAGAEDCTYVYHAPIRSTGADASTVGGIAIVFNAIPELQAMLGSALVSKPKTRAMYVTRQGLVLASTDPTIPSGSTMALPTAQLQQLLQVQAGASEAVIAIHQQQYCILGASVSRGYREFKTSDGYRDDVLAISVETFGHVEDNSQSPGAASHAIQASSNSMQGIEMATFYVGQQMFALRAESVLEALPAEAISPVSAGRLPYCVGTLPRHTQGQVTGYVWVFDLAELLTGQRGRVTEQSQVVVLEHGERKLGVLVSALHGVHHFAQESIIAAPSMASGPELLVSELIKANQGALLVQCISPQGLLHALQRKPQAPALNSHEQPSGALRT